MNPFLNPLTGLPALKNLLRDPERIRGWSPERLEKYRNAAFKRIVDYAYTVPVYQKKYQQRGIASKDIQGLQDSTKLPFVSKKDIVDNYPDGLLPLDYNKKHVVTVSTGGSSGKPVSIFTDFSVMTGGIGSSIRLLSEAGLHWRKARMVSIGNFNPGKADAAAQQVFYSKAKSMNLLGNYIFISVFDPLKKIMEELDKFQPEMILSYPTTFQNLAYLKKKGYGTHLNPKVLFVRFGFSPHIRVRQELVCSFHHKMSFANCRMSGSTSECWWPSGCQLLSFIFFTTFLFIFIKGRLC